MDSFSEEPQQLFGLIADFHPAIRRRERIGRALIIHEIIPQGWQAQKKCEKKKRKNGLPFPVTDFSIKMEIFGHCLHESNNSSLSLSDLGRGSPNGGRSFYLISPEKYILVESTANKKDLLLFN